VLPFIKICVIVSNIVFFTLLLFLSSNNIFYLTVRIKERGNIIRENAIISHTNKMTFIFDLLHVEQLKNIRNKPPPILFSKLKFSGFLRWYFLLLKMWKFCIRLFLIESLIQLIFWGFISLYLMKFCKDYRNTFLLLLIIRFIIHFSFIFLLFYEILLGEQCTLEQ